MMDRLAYTVREAAEAMGVSSEACRRAVQSGEIASVRFAGRVLIPAVELERLCGVERPREVTPGELVDLFAALVGVDRKQAS